MSEARGARQPREVGGRLGTRLDPGKHPSHREMWSRLDGIRHNCRQNVRMASTQLRLCRDNQRTGRAEARNGGCPIRCCCGTADNPVFATLCGRCRRPVKAAPSRSLQLGPVPPYLARQCRVPRQASNRLGNPRLGRRSLRHQQGRLRWFCTPWSKPRREKSRRSGSVVFGSQSCSLSSIAMSTREPRKCALLLQEECRECPQSHLRVSSTVRRHRARLMDICVLRFPLEFNRLPLSSAYRKEMGQCRIHVQLAW